MVIPTRRSLYLFRVRVSLPVAQSVHICGGVTMRTSSIHNTIGAHQNGWNRLFFQNVDLYKAFCRKCPTLKHVDEPRDDMDRRFKDDIMSPFKAHKRRRKRKGGKAVICTTGVT